MPFLGGYTKQRSFVKEQEFPRVVSQGAIAAGFSRANHLPGGIPWVAGALLEESVCVSSASFPNFLKQEQPCLQHPW